MSALVFKLRNVPEDEADDIRQLLNDRNIEIYETSAGNWGISMPGIWVKDDADLAPAKKLIKEYQQSRATSARAEYNADLEAGNVPSLVDRFRQRPIAFIGIVLFCLFVVYAMTAPFIRLGLQQ